MPVAETASTFNEVLTVTAAIAGRPGQRREAGPDRKPAVRRLPDHLRHLLPVPVRVLGLRGRVARSSWTPTRLCQLMLERPEEGLRRRSGPDLPCTPICGLCKGHYYSGSLSFYNFPYAFGGLFARGLYAKYQQEGEKLRASV